MANSFRKNVILTHYILPFSKINVNKIKSQQDILTICTIMRHHFWLSLT